MTKYKYRVEVRPDGRDLADWLNEHAADGWRLIQVSDGLYYFEREVQEIETKV